MNALLIRAVGQKQLVTWVPVAPVHEYDSETDFSACFLGPFYEFIQRAKIIQ